jgi:hypothetical protein
MPTEYEVLSSESLRSRFDDPDWVEAPVTERISPLTVVELPDDPAECTIDFVEPSAMRVLVGIASRVDTGAPMPVGFDILLAEDGPEADGWVYSHDSAATLAAISDSCAANPIAALTLVQLLRTSPRIPLAAALVSEATAYSMLLGGQEFGHWLSERPNMESTPAERPVLIQSTEDGCTIILNRPDVHNAYNAAMRDALVEVLRALLPTDIPIALRGAGRSFCSGGDLSEFGRSDPATAYSVRVARSPGLLLAHLGERITANVHGSCIGAGAELPAFCARVHAAPDAVFRLPEVAMGLIPGAGGTVSLPRRIGRGRTNYLSLSGAEIDAGTALRWGLVDEIVEP